MPEIVELNIGHFLVGEAMFVGLAAPSRRCAPRWIAARAPARRESMILGHRLRHHRHPPHREGDRAPWRALPRAHLHRGRARARRAPRQARRDLCQAFRRQGGLRQGARHRHARAACSGATWAWSTCRRHARPCTSTGGALKRLEKMTPAGHEARIDLTITDEFPLAQAFVIISAVPAKIPPRPPRSQGSADGHRKPFAPFRSRPAGLRCGARPSASRVIALLPFVDRATRAPTGGGATYESPEADARDDTEQKRKEGGFAETVAWSSTPSSSRW